MWIAPSSSIICLVGLFIRRLQYTFFFIFIFKKVLSKSEHLNRGIEEIILLESGVRRNPYFCLKCLKIKELWDFESDLYPCCTPILYGFLERQNFVNWLPSIKKPLDSSNRSYILVVTEFTMPLTFMRNPVRLFYPIKIRKEVHKTGSLFCGYWKRDIWK